MAPQKASFIQNGQWEGVQIRGEGSGIQKKKCNRQNCHSKINLCSRFHRNRDSVQNQGEMFGENGGGMKWTLKNMQMSQIPSQNQSTHHILSESDYGKVFKSGGETGAKFRVGIQKKTCKTHKCHSKINLCSKFHPNRTMGKC